MQKEVAHLELSETLRDFESFLWGLTFAAPQFGAGEWQWIRWVHACAVSAGSRLDGSAP